MNDDTFIFLDEFLDTELYRFLNKCKEKILKFVWKDKNIEKNVHSEKVKIEKNGFLLKELFLNEKEKLNPLIINQRKFK